MARGILASSRKNSSIAALGLSVSSFAERGFRCSVGDFRRASSKKGSGDGLTDKVICEDFAFCPTLLSFDSWKSCRASATAPQTLSRCCFVTDDPGNACIRPLLNDAANWDCLRKLLPDKTK